MPRHSSIFPGDTPNGYELERRLRAAEMSLRDERQRCTRLENLIEYRAQLISSYLEEEKEWARDRIDMLEAKRAMPGSADWDEYHQVKGIKAFIKRAMRDLGPAMRSASE